MISHPRTNSQKLPSTIDYRAILGNLNRLHRYKSLTTELLALQNLKPREGEKEDPAHPAIYPTGNQPERCLTVDEENIFDLVIRRFMAVFGTSVVIQEAKAYINLGGHLFFLKGRSVISRAR